MRWRPITFYRLGCPHQHMLHGSSELCHHYCHHHFIPWMQYLGSIHKPRLNSLPLHTAKQWCNQGYMYDCEPCKLDGQTPVFSENRVNFRWRSVGIISSVLPYTTLSVYPVRVSAYRSSIFQIFESLMKDRIHNRNVQVISFGQN